MLHVSDVRIYFVDEFVLSYKNDIYIQLVFMTPAFPKKKKRYGKCPIDSDAQLTKIIPYTLHVRTRIIFCHILLKCYESEGWGFEFPSSRDVFGLKKMTLSQEHPSVSRTRMLLPTLHFKYYLYFKNIYTARASVKKYGTANARPW